MLHKMLVAFFVTRAHCWLMIHLVFTSLPCTFLQSSFSAGQPPILSLVHGAVPSQVLDFARPLVELRKVPTSPFLQPVKVPLNGRYWGGSRTRPYKGNQLWGAILEQGVGPNNFQRSLLTATTKSFCEMWVFFQSSKEGTTSIYYYYYSGGL